MVQFSKHSFIKHWITKNCVGEKLAFSICLVTGLTFFFYSDGNIKTKYLWSFQSVVDTQR